MMVADARTSSRPSRAERASRTADLLEQLGTCTDEARCEEIRQEIVVVNRRVAEAVAARYRNRGIADEDLVQVAYLGLVKAVARFDADLGHDLLTFAVPTIRGELTRHFRDHGWAVRPPRRVQELQSRINHTVELLAQDMGREPDVDEVITTLDLTRDEYDEAAGARGCFRPTSLDQPAGLNSSSSLGDLLVDAGEVDPHGVSDARTTLAPVIRELNARDQRILYLRFFEERSQSEIGEAIGVSQVQVSRLLSRVLERLRSEIGAV